MDDIDVRFDHHPPADAATVQRHEDMRAIFKATAKAAVDRMPPDMHRERALVLTNLEQALFWANAGIARHGK